jgi:gas vesicle protein
MRHQTSLTTPFLLGAFAGAAIALLYAPARGRDTRSYLRRRARSGVDAASRAVETGRSAIIRQKSRVKHAVEEGQEHLGAAAGHVSEMATTARVASGEIAREGRAALNEVRQAVRSTGNAASDIAADTARSTR